MLNLFDRFSYRHPDLDCKRVCLPPPLPLSALALRNAGVCIEREQKNSLAGNRDAIAFICYKGGSL
jgi:hypothetical protein